METSTERFEKDQVKVTVTIPEEDVKEFVDTAYKQVSKYRIAGFRPGRAPRKVLDSHFGKDGILGEATNIALGTYEPKVINQENISALGEPEYDLDGQDHLEEGQPFTYHMTFNVKPVLELTSYDPVEIELPFKEASEAEIEKQIERFQGYYTTYEDSKSKRMVKKGDYIALTITSDDEASNVENMLYCVGDGVLPEHVDKALVGMKPGETKEVPLIDPDKKEASDDKTEADEKAETAQITVVMHKDKVVPEVDDEFAKNSFGFDTVEEMKKSIKEDVERQKEQILPEIKEKNAIHEIGKRAEGEVSQLYRSIVFNDLIREFFDNLQRSGTTLDQYLISNNLSSDQFRADMEKQAEDVARESLALDALSRHLKLEATEDDVLAELAANGLEDPEGRLEEFKLEGKLPSIKDYVVRTKAIEWLVENAKVTEVDMVGRDKEEKDQKEKKDKK